MTGLQTRLDWSAETRKYFAQSDAQGGAIPALESGFFQREIADASARYQREVDAGERVIVGVNRYADEAAIAIRFWRWIRRATSARSSDLKSCAGRGTARP